MKTNEDSGQFILSWSEATEAALRKIEEGVILLRSKLHTLLGADNATEQLESMGQPFALLTTGEMPEGPRGPGCLCHLDPDECEIHA